MAWPKLRNKSSGPLMMEGNRSGAAHDGARSQGKEAEGAPEGPARLPFLRAQGPRKTEAAGGSGPVRDAAVRDAPVSWPGQSVDEAASAEETAAAGARGGAGGGGGGGGAGRGPGGAAPRRAGRAVVGRPAPRREFGAGASRRR